MKFQIPRIEEFVRELLKRSWAHHTMETFRFTMFGIGGTRPATSYYHSVYVLTTDVCAVVYIYVLNACVTSELVAHSLFTLDYHPEPTDFNANPPTLVFLYRRLIISCPVATSIVRPHSRRKASTSTWRPWRSLVQLLPRELCPLYDSTSCWEMFSRGFSNQSAIKQQLREQHIALLQLL